MNYRYYPYVYNRSIRDFECIQPSGCVVYTNADYLIRNKLSRLYGKNWSKLGEFYYGDNGHVLAKIETTELVSK